MPQDEQFIRLTTLTTPRLRIRQMLERDAEALFEFKSDPKVAKLYAQDSHRSIDETKAWTQRCLAYYEKRESISWVITFPDVDRAVGSCCFWNFDPSHQCAELGYELHPAYWREGIMTEALSALLSYGFVDLGLHRIEACPLGINKPSQNLLLKLGFKREGVLRERLCFHGQYDDQLYFGLLGKEWMSRP